jgi:hypothetical protein
LGVRFFGSGDEVGFISVGQHAVGVIALGQNAVGIIAIGQVARGVVAVGQLGVGVFTAGQLSLGIGYAIMGVGGNGKVALRLVPRLEPPREYPPCTNFAAVQAGWGDGWVDADMAFEADETLALHADGQRLPVKIAATLIPRAKVVMGTAAGSRVLAHIRRKETCFVADRLMSVPRPSQEREGFWTWLLVRTAFLILLACLVWVVALWPLLLELTKLFR